jgi:DNA-binding MarR family transcriptional regulator
MPRPPIRPLVLEPTREVMAPVVELADPRSAMQALVTWVTSSTLRARVMEESGFPLAGDLPAFLVVNQLAYRGVARPTDLADAVHTGRSNVSKIVRRLEDAGLVGRMANPENQRETIIALAPEGRRLAARMVSVLDSVLEPAFADFSPEEVATFQLLVHRLAADLNQSLYGAVARSAGLPGIER